MLVSVDDAHAEDMSAVADRLRQAGMLVQQTMDLLGTVSGSIEADGVDRLRGLDGVRDVELSRTVQLPPRDSPVQ